MWFVTKENERSSVVPFDDSTFSRSRGSTHEINITRQRFANNSQSEDNCTFASDKQRLDTMPDAYENFNMAMLMNNIIPDNDAESYFAFNGNAREQAYVHLAFVSSARVRKLCARIALEITMQYYLLLCYCTFNCAVPHHSRTRHDSALNMSLIDCTCAGVCVPTIPPIIARFLCYIDAFKCNSI